MPTLDTRRRVFPSLPISDLKLGFAKYNAAALCDDFTVSSARARARLLGFGHFDDHFDGEVGHVDNSASGCLHL